MYFKEFTPEAVIERYILHFPNADVVLYDFNWKYHCVFMHYTITVIVTISFNKTDNFTCVMGTNLFLLASFFMYILL